MSNEEKAITISNVELTDQGIIKCKTLDELKIYAESLRISGMVPKGYDTAAKILVGIQYARELNLRPLTALKNIAVINGIPQIWGEVPLAIVRASGLMQYFDEYHLDDEMSRICVENKNLKKEIYAAVCEVQRKGEQKREFVFTREDASTIPNANNPKNMIWRQYKKRMYTRKARSLALKDVFTDLLQGAEISEYDYNYIPKEGEFTNIDHDGMPTQEEKAKAFNAKFEEIENE